MIEAAIYPGGSAAADRTFTSGEIIGYTVSDRLAGAGLPLGGAASAKYTLTLGLRGLTGLEGAKVRVTDGQTPLGVWYVTGVQEDACLPRTVLSGADALSTVFENGFTDSAAAYPRTVQSLMEALCAAAPGTALAEDGFHNSSLVISRLPGWRGGITLRQALSDAAFVCGGFMRVEADGSARVVSALGGDTYTVSAADCLAFTRGSGAPFELGRLLYRFEGDSGYTVYTVDQSKTGAARGDGNPLVTSGVMNDLKTWLAGFAYEAASLRYRPAAPPRAGDRLNVTLPGGGVCSLLLTGVYTELDAGGLTCRCESVKPVSAGAYNGKSVFNSDGTLCFEAIGDADSRISSLTNAYIRSLTAGEITASGLSAKIIEAVKLRAQSIGAAEVSTDLVTACLAEIVNATVRKLDAGTLSADALSAAIVNTLALKVERLTGADIATDRLAAALSEFGVITAGSAAFDRATVRHLLSEALFITYGAGDEVFISNLSADYARLVSANVGSLCVKGADGNFYNLTVDAGGNVSAAQVSVSAAEAESGVTSAGRAIIETEIAASDLSATGIKAVRALINRLDAARIDTDTLTARQAFIDRLNTRDITSNTYLRLALTAIREALDESEELDEKLRSWLTFDSDGLKQGREGSAFSTLINESGFHIVHRGSVEPVGSFDRNGLTAPGVKLGAITARRTARGGWVWREES